MTIFYDMMSECDDNEVNNRTRYIMMKLSSKAANDSTEPNSCEVGEATGGGEAVASETVAEQIFLETTV